MHRMAILCNRLSVVCCVALAAVSAPAWAKPPVKAAAKPAAKPQAKADAKPTVAPAKTASPLRQDELLARVLAGIDRALAAKPAGAAPAGPDLAEALLIGVARSSLVAALHGHFALTGLGHALRSGAMKGPETAVMAATMAQNYKGLAVSFAMLAQQKDFDGELAQVWMSLGNLATLGHKACEAFGLLAAEPADGARLAVFEAALDDYRNRLHTLMQAVQGPQQHP